MLKSVIFLLYFVHWCDLEVKDERGQGQKSGSKVKVTFNVKEKAGGRKPMSSCFIKRGVVKLSQNF